MLDGTTKSAHTNSVKTVSEKAQAMVCEARQLAANTHKVSAQLGVDEKLQQQVKNAQQALQLTIDQIEAVKTKITAERKLAQEQLDEIQLTASQAQAQVDGLMNQISAKESEIQRLSEQTTCTEIWPFGEISVPDPTASAQMGVLQIEVAGLYTTLATAKMTFATAKQGEIALSTQIAHVPIEADSRLIDLYITLEAEKTGLSALEAQVLARAKQAFRAIFTTENKCKIVTMASQKIDTGFPDEIEADLFFDAIGQIEEALVEAIPAKALDLTQTVGEGLDCDTHPFVERLTQKVNKAGASHLCHRDKYSGLTGVRN